MKRTSSRLRWTVALLLALGLVAAGCGSDDNGGSSSSSTTKASGPKLASAEVKGGGATFPAAFYDQTRSDFQDANSGVTVLYNPLGSGAGRQQFGAGTLDFAGSDSLPKPEETFKGPYLFFPTVAGPITVSYNLSGVEDLQLSADTLAGIYQGDITKWNDDKVKADNPKADLPDTDIKVIVRAEASGTTSNFTKYLAKAAPGVFTIAAGDQPTWPTSFTKAQGNSGMAQSVSDTDGGIAYVDYSDAKAAQLTFASIKNAAGKYVAPSIEGATAAVAGATPKPDLTYDPLNAEGADAYPITAPTYILAYTSYSDAAVGNALKAFIKYVLTTGQETAPSVDFAPLPKDLATQAIAQLDKITVG
jgi:phosphate transport system substrate-binding protein